MTAVYMMLLALKCRHLTDSRFVTRCRSTSQSFSLASFKRYWRRVQKILSSPKNVTSNSEKKFLHQLIVGYAKTLQNKFLLFAIEYVFISVFQLG